MAIRWMGLTALVLAMGFACAAARSAFAWVAHYLEPAFSKSAVKTSIEQIGTEQWAAEDFSQLEEMLPYPQLEEETELRTI